jgi:hypothetical protein
MGEPFPSLSSLRRPHRREGCASAGAGAPAGRPADAPTALTGGPVLRSRFSVAVLRRVDSTAEGGLGKPGPTVQSRNGPSLLLDWCSRRSCRFVVAGAARVAGVLLGKRSGSGPAGVRGGSRNALCLQGVSAAFRIRRSLGCGCGVVTPDRIMLAVERAGLAQAGAAVSIPWP